VVRMANKRDEAVTEKDEKDEKDERLAIPLDPEAALRGLLAVDPESHPSDSDRETPSPTASRRPSGWSSRD
jgi:hypothetical protein